ncbi:MAG TPA: hypothetical protein VGJ28_17430 [Micromonosporaceae bacterium]|jgi:hypothetical protein
MAEWWSIEILDHADLTANQWREARGSALIEAAISNGVQDWEWHRTHWGVVFEVAFADWDSWRAYRELPAVIAALDAAPDPINGVAIYPGRGGNAGSRVPRRPGPIRGAGAAAIPQTPEPAWVGPALIERVLVGVA